jgi:hypothetical protein
MYNWISLEAPPNYYISSNLIAPRLSHNPDHPSIEGLFANRGNSRASMEHPLTASDTHKLETFKFGSKPVNFPAPITESALAN